MVICVFSLANFSLANTPTAIPNHLQPTSATIRASRSRHKQLPVSSGIPLFAPIIGSLSIDPINLRDDSILARMPFAKRNRHPPLGKASLDGYILM
ncbi:hypothetical protein EJ08DRAFT_164089 [Tothia fuscella]|uniref:Uncharacterized protein n=1 Tax=Tothia fuscella TaxID=1048955 RepID=A0A9P4TS35_9PEZI|nr:hypothetical protein EJ08DRAFT_164089 [Tothia fuscella]